MASTFRSLQKNNSQSDYIKTKKINKCLYLYNKKEILMANKKNIVISQYSKLNLKDICVISVGPPPTKPCSSTDPCNPCQNNSPVIIDPSILTTPFYLNYTIDPLGQLFGRSQCGELNYTKYIEF